MVVSVQDWMSSETKPDYLSCLKRRFPPASEEECTDFEQFLGVTLSNKYRQFLKTTNGGSFAWCSINMQNVEDNGGRPVPPWQTLEALQTLSNDIERDSPLSLYDDGNSMRVLHAGEHVMLQIGYTIDSNLIYLGVSDEIFGQVYLKTSLLPVLVNGEYKQYDSEWFLLGEDFDSFLQRLGVIEDQAK